ncbi:uncharacterized protein TNCV_1062181 [Trichonephila clavipes]|nr:uncharacterized protein TNCV_1062181 [Trichonephila clavipes]
MNLTWQNPPAHYCYTAKSPGLSMQFRSSRTHQTALVRFRSSHLRSMTFVQRVKSFFICPCFLLTSPAHLLDCWGISLRQLYEEQGQPFAGEKLKIGSDSLSSVAVHANPLAGVVPDQITPAVVPHIPSLILQQVSPLSSSFILALRVRLPPQTLSHMFKE